MRSWPVFNPPSSPLAWEYDKQGIDEHRAFHNPVSDFERFMMEFFSGRTDRIEGWMQAGEVSDTTLPSGLRIIVKEKTKKNKTVREELVLSGEGDVMNYEIFPQPDPPVRRELTEEDRKRIDEKLKRLGLAGKPRKRRRK